MNYTLDLGFSEVCFKSLTNGLVTICDQTSPYYEDSKLLTHILLQRFEELGLMVFVACEFFLEEIMYYTLSADTAVCYSGF